MLALEKFAALISDKSAPGGVCLLWRGKCAQVYAPTIDCYSSDKARLLVCFAHAARQISPLAAACIPIVLLACNDSQIFKSVICLFAIYVVNLLDPFSGAHRPNHSVNSGSEAVVYTYHDVAVFAVAPNLSARITRVPNSVPAISSKMMSRARPPKQAAGPCIVAEAFMQIICGRQPSHRGFCHEYL